MPQITIKPIANIVAKWKNKAGGASGDYKDGITFAPDQGAAAAAAADTWFQGVTAPDVQARFASRAAASTAKWKKNAENLGPSRYTQGVANAVDEYQKGVSPALDVLRGLEIPARKPKGDPSNNDIVRFINMKQREAALARRK
jgi:uncharacterized membrane-anchored protein